NSLQSAPPLVPARGSLECLQFVIIGSSSGLLKNARPTMLDISQIDHCSVLITDVERSRRFYRDLLGLREIHKPRTFDFVVLWFDLGDQHLHLLLKDAPDAISPRHFALRVADAARAREYFRGRGVAVQETTPIPGAA